MNIVNLSELFAKPEVKGAIVEIRRTLRKALPQGSFGEREAAALAINNEATRVLLQEELQEMADGLGEEVMVDGELYKVHEAGTDIYHGLCGPLDVRRATYRKVGERNGPTIVPLELMAGMVEGATPALGYNVAHGYAQHDMRVHEESLRAAHRLPPSRTTLERIAKRIGSAAIESGPRIEAVLREGCPRHGGGGDGPGPHLGRDDRGPAGRRCAEA
jgi:hypothetical protein